MPPSLASLERGALGLPVAQRAQLADRILTSLDDEARAEIDAWWATEVERRVDEYDRGEVEGIPVAEVFARARRLLQE